MGGLANVGNTCSINTLVQCLGYCDTFRNELLNNIHFCKKKDKKFSIGDEFKMIIKQLWVDNHSLVPIRFIHALQETIGSNFKVGREEMDITEVFMIVLDNMIEESHDINAKIDFYKPYNNDNKLNTYLNKKTVDIWKLHNKFGNSLLLNLFQGTLIQQVRCKSCEYICHNIEPFKFIHINISDPNIVSFTEHLQKYFNPVSVPDWKCDKCNSNDNNEKLIKIWNFPKIIVFILNRYKDDGTKCSIPIKIPNKISFACGAEMKYPEQSKEYRIKSIANHEGDTIYSGHYNAMCYNKENQNWVIHDDIRVEKINEKNANTFLEKNYNCYALFYETL